MKLTDEKILELASESGVVYRAHHAGCINAYVDGTDLTVFVLDFARAILKEAGVGEMERKPVAWRVFDGEGGYDYVSYTGNESYQADFVEHNGVTYACWVEPLYLPVELDQ